MPEEYNQTEVEETIKQKKPTQRMKLIVEKKTGIEVILVSDIFIHSSFNNTRRVIRQTSFRGKKDTKPYDFYRMNGIYHVQGGTITEK